VRRLAGPALAGLALLAAGCGERPREGRPDPRAPAAPTRETSTFVPSSARSPAVVWAVGDGADGGRRAHAVVRRIAAGRPDRLLYLGDLYSGGGAEDYRRNYAPTYGRLARITAPTPGDNEWDSRASGYDPYWTRVHGRRPPHYYAFSLAGWRILSLNSQIAHHPGSPQHRWLLAQVRGPGTCRLAFWHRPRFSAGVGHGDQPDMSPLWRALEGRATLVVSGHDHDMQRLRPVGGVVQMVSGAGGHERYAVRRRDPRVAFADDRHDGALRLVLAPGSVRYAFVLADGRVADSGRMRCRR
jgi:hypothetical protein